MPAGIISLDVVGADEKGSRWLYASRLFVACILFGYFAQIYRQSEWIIKSKICLNVQSILLAQNNLPT